MTLTKYPSINGLRAISIILVISYHLSLMFGVYKDVDFEYAWWVGPLFYFIQDGDLGVNVFFVISGFLISSVILNEEFNFNTISIKNFFIRRTLRIFPAYFFLLIVYAVLQIIGCIDISNLSWLTAITYTKYFNWELDWYTAHGWSLSIEEHFYLFWPFVFLLGNTFRKRFTVFLILLVPIIRLILFYNPVEWMNENTIFTRIDAVAVGCFFALYKDEIVKIIKPVWFFVFIISILTLIFFPNIKPYINRPYLDILFIGLGLTHGSIANIAIALIMMYSVFGPQRIWFKFLNSKIMNYIGLLSYSLYLWQQFFLIDTLYYHNQYPFNLIYLVMAALCSYYLIEKPFLKLKKKYTTKV